MAKKPYRHKKPPPVYWRKTSRKVKTGTVIKRKKMPKRGY